MSGRGMLSPARSKDKPDGWQALRPGMEKTVQVIKAVENGSPGRARTADLVINSSRNTLSCGQKVEETKTLFCGRSD